MREILFSFVTQMIVPITLSVMIIFIIATLKRLVEDYYLKKLVMMTVKSVEQTKFEEDSYFKLEAVKDYVLSKFDIEEEDLIVLIEATIYDLKV